MRSCIADVRPTLRRGHVLDAAAWRPRPGRRRSSARSRCRRAFTTRISLTYNSTATDKTIRLLWSSARQAKQVIPQFALFPEDALAGGLGAGLNVAYFATTTVNNVVKPDLGTARRRCGRLRDGFLADAGDRTDRDAGRRSCWRRPRTRAAATPPPPNLVRPRYEDQVSAATPKVEVIGIGGLPGGSVRIGLDSGSDRRGHRRDWIRRRVRARPSTSEHSRRRRRSSSSCSGPRGRPASSPPSANAATRSPGRSRSWKTRT